MYARLSLLIVAVAAMLAGPRVATAQQQAHASAAAGPRLERTATAMQRPAVTDTILAIDSASVVLQRRTSGGRPVALMIVGGAAFVLGAVIDDPVGTLFMVGGAVAFLYGLYQYLQ